MARGSAGPAVFRPANGPHEAGQAAALAGQPWLPTDGWTAFVLVDVPGDGPLALRGSVLVETGGDEWRVRAVGCANPAAWPAVCLRLAEDLAMTAIAGGVRAVRADGAAGQCGEVVAAMPGRALISELETWVEL